MISKSQIFIAAHKAAKIDMADDKADKSPYNHHSYAYYFRLQLINQYALLRPMYLTKEMMTDGRIAR